MQAAAGLLRYMCSGVQATTNDATHNYLQDSFATSLQRGFTASLDRIGKGWFNLNETNPQMYAQSKLFRLLTAIRYMMEDAVRALVLSSLDSFLESTRRACACTVVVHSTARVDVTRVAGARRSPLLSVSLAAEGATHEIGYADEVGAFPERMAGVALRGVKAAQGIAQLEPLVMTKLHWSYRPPLHAAHPQEAAVEDVAAAVRAAWAVAVAPLATYRALFARYEAVLARDNEAQVAALVAKGAELTLSEVQGELSAAEAQLAAIRSEIPVAVRDFA